MMRVCCQDPTERKDWTVGFGPRLKGDTIASCSLTVDTGLTVTKTNDTQSVTVWTEGGSSGNKYRVTVRVVTAAGRKYSKSFIVHVKQEA